jgi:hypothetical protein
MALPVLRIVAFVALLVAASTPAAATDVQVSLKDGRVTILADNVPVRKILEDWARVGQIRIVNLEKLTGPPVSLRLDNVPEKDALDVLLRSAAGYVAAPRSTDVAGASRFDRILILATSRPPAASPASASSGGQAPQPIVPQPVADDSTEAEEGGEPMQSPPPGMMQPGMPGTPGPLQLQPNPTPFPGTADATDQPAPPQQPLTLPRPGIVPLPQSSQPGAYPTTTAPGTQPVPGPTAITPNTGTAQKPPPKKPGGKP